MTLLNDQNKPLDNIVDPYEDNEAATVGPDGVPDLLRSPDPVYDPKQESLTKSAIARGVVDVRPYEEEFEEDAPSGLQAYMEEYNPIAGFLAMGENVPDNFDEYDMDFDPVAYANSLDIPEQDRADILFARNQGEADWLLGYKAKQRQNKEVLDELGMGYHFGYAFLADLINPIAWAAWTVPWVRGGSLATRMGKGAAIFGGEGLATEATMYGIQTERTMEDVAVGVTANVFLGGVLGGAGGLFKSKAGQEMLDRLPDDAVISKDGGFYTSTYVDEVVKEGAAAGTSVGAKETRVYNLWADRAEQDALINQHQAGEITIDELNRRIDELAYEAWKAPGEAVLRWGKELTPSTSLGLSMNWRMREAVNKLAENTLVRNFHRAGKRTDHAVDTASETYQAQHLQPIMKILQAGYAEEVGTKWAVKQAFMPYTQGKMKVGEFYNRVYRAYINDGVDELGDPIVEKTAKEIMPYMERFEKDLVESRMLSPENYIEGRDLMLRAKELDAEYADRVSRLEAAETRLETAGEEIRNLKKQKEIVQKKLDDWKEKTGGKKAARLQKRIGAMQEQGRILSRSIAKQEEELTVLKQANKDAEKLETDLKAKIKEAEGATDRVRSGKMAISQSQKALKDFGAIQEGRKGGRRRKGRAATKETKAQLRAQIAKAERAVAREQEVATQGFQARKALDEASPEIQASRERLAAAQKNLEQAKAAAKKVAEDEKKATATFRKQTKQNPAQKATTNALKADIAKAERGIKSLEGKYKADRETVSGFKKWEEDTNLEREAIGKKLKDFEYSEMAGAVKGQSRYLPRMFKINVVHKRKPEFIKRTSDDLEDQILKGPEEPGLSAEELAKAEADKAKYLADPIAARKQIEKDMEDTWERITRSNMGWERAQLGGASRFLTERKLSVRTNALIGKGGEDSFIEDDIMRAITMHSRALTPHMVAKQKGWDLATELDEVNSVFKRLMDDAPDQKTRNRIAEKQRKETKKLRDMDELVRGHRLHRQNEWRGINEMVTAIKNWNIMRLLGSMPISAIPDLGSIIAINGLTQFAGTMGKMAMHPQKTKMAREAVSRYDLITDRLMASRFNLIAGADDMAPNMGVAARLSHQASQAFVRHTGMNWQNQTLKEFALVDYSDNLVRTAMKFDFKPDGSYTAKGLSKHDITQFAKAGISVDDFRRLKQMYGKYGKNEGGLYIMNIDKWTGDTSEKAFRDHMFQTLEKHSNTAIITPTKGDLPIWMRSDLGSIMLQFKSFSFAATNRLLIPGIQKAAMGDPTMLVGLSTMMMLGSLSYGLKMKLQGREVDTSFPTLFREAMDRSGYFGIYVDINAITEKVSRNHLGIAGIYKALGIDTPELSRYYTRPISGDILGPTYGLTEDSAKFIGGLISGDMNKGDISGGRRMLPYQNMWYLRNQVNKAQEWANERWVE
jgi:hypothetical protein